MVNISIKQLNYLITIAKYQNITIAASKLYISRSALNGFLLDLEQEIGIQLFTRFNKKLILTDAGEKFLTTAKEIVLLYGQMDKELNEIKDGSYGCLRIGVNRSIGEKLFRSTFPLFHKKYPNYQIKLFAGEHIENNVVNGDIDWGIIGYGSELPLASGLAQIPLGTSEIVLALPSSHPLAIYAAPEGEPHNTLDLKLLANDQFVLLKPGTNARMMADKCFKEAEINPPIVIECNGGMIASQMVKDGIGPSILVETLVSNDPRVKCFSLTPKAYWVHAVVYREGTSFTKAENYFLNLIRNQSQYANVLPA